MTVDDALARLRAGLERDEADAVRARAAAEGPGGDGHLWIVTGSDNAVGVDYDPAAELRRVEAIRRVLAECEGAEYGHAEAYDLAYNVGEILASIYPDPTEEPSNG